MNHVAFNFNPVERGLGRRGKAREQLFMFILPFRKLWVLVRGITEEHI